MSAQGPLVLGLGLKGLGTGLDNSKLCFIFSKNCFKEDISFHFVNLLFCEKVSCKKLLTIQFKLLLEKRLSPLAVRSALPCSSLL